MYVFSVVEIPGIPEVGDPRNLKFAMMKSLENEQRLEPAKNVVYQEVLLKTC